MRGYLKKIISLTTSVVLSAVMLSVGSITVFADSQYMDKDKIYSDDGGKMTYISNDKFLYRYVGDTAGVTVCGYVGKDTDIVIPDELNGRVVTGIDEGLFADNDKITSVTISSEVLTIGEGSFEGCDALVQVNLGGGTEILENVFNNCTDLESISVPYGINEINNSFKDCTSLKKIKFSRSVSKLGDGSFNGCTSLDEIQWSTGLTYLGDVFDNAECLESIHVPKGIVIIDGAFDSCTGAKNLEFPDSLLYINSGFNGCESLSEIEFPNGLIYIGKAFENCTSLKGVNVSADTDIDEAAFEGCESMSIKKNSNLWRIVAIVTLLLMFAACVAYTLYKAMLQTSEQKSTDKNVAPQNDDNEKN